MVNIGKSFEDLVDLERLIIFTDESCQRFAKRVSSFHNAGDSPRLKIILQLEFFMVLQSTRQSLESNRLSQESNQLSVKSNQQSLESNRMNLEDHALSQKTQSLALASHETAQIASMTARLTLSVL